MLVSTQYDLGQLVYLKTDKDQSRRMVISVSVRPAGVLYDLALGGTSSWHYELEISEEKDTLLAVT